jgi:transposase
MKSFFNKLLNLPKTEIIDYKIEDNKVYLTVQSTYNEIPCRQCGGPTKSKGYSEEREIRHLPMNEQECYLVIKAKRGICETCDEHPTTNQRLGWYEYKSRYTKDYLKSLMILLVNSTLEDVAIKQNLSSTTIARIVTEQISNSVNWKEFDRLGLVGVDEIAIKKGYNNYLTIVTSKYKENIRILAVLKGREKAVIKAFLKKIPSRLKRTITGYCCDMSEGYVNAAREVLKSTPIIIDRFHVAKLYRKCLVNLRKSELIRLRKKLSTNQYGNLKLAISILRRNIELVTAEERQELDKLFKYSPKLQTGYRFCRQLTSIYNSKIGRRRASNKINQWLGKVEVSELECFDSFIKTLNKYKTHIIQYFKGRHTSGFVEGFNNKIKVIKRRCYGIFDENSLFRRIFLDTEGYARFLNRPGFALV